MKSLDGFVSEWIETAFREYVLTESGLLIKSIGHIDFPNPLQKRNEEVDLFGETYDGWIIGECKWKNSPVGFDVLNLLEMRRNILVGDENTDYFILSKSGFSDDLAAFASTHTDIHLISGEDIFGR